MNYLLFFSPQTFLSCPPVKRKLPLSRTTVSRNMGSASVKETQSRYMLKRRFMNSGPVSNMMREKNRLRSLRMLVTHIHLSPLSAGRRMGRRTQNHLYKLRLKTVKARNSFRIYRKQNLYSTACLSPQLHKFWFKMEEKMKDLLWVSQTKYRQFRAPLSLLENPQAYYKWPQLLSIAAICVINLFRPITT